MPGVSYFCSKDDSSGVTALPGDSVSVKQVNAFHAVSPLPGQFRLLKDGQVIDASREDAYEYRWRGPVERGVYRIEVHLNFSNGSVPWIYANPVYVY